MNTNKKGSTGLIKVIDDLQTKGYFCFFPFDDHSPIDLIAVNDEGKVYRLQVKYRGSDYTLQAYSVINGIKTPINRDLIDGWACYLSLDNKVVYISTTFMSGRKSHKINLNTNLYEDIDNW